MSMYYVEIGFLVTNYGTADRLEAHLDCVLDALYEDDRVTDPDYGASLGDGRAEFSLSLDAEGEPHAVEAALLAIRTAIHTAEGCTQGWETHFQELQTLIRRADLVTA